MCVLWKIFVKKNGFFIHQKFKTILLIELEFEIHIFKVIVIQKKIRTPFGKIGHHPLRVCPVIDIVIFQFDNHTLVNSGRKSVFM